MAILLFHLFHNIFGKDCSSMNSVRKRLPSWWSALLCGRGLCSPLFLPRFTVGSQQKRKSLCTLPQWFYSWSSVLAHSRTEIQEMKSLRSCRAAGEHGGPCASPEVWWRNPRTRKRQNNVQWTVSEPGVIKTQKMKVSSAWHVSRASPKASHEIAANDWGLICCLISIQSFQVFFLSFHMEWSSK